MTIRRRKKTNIKGKRGTGKRKKKIKERKKEKGNKDLVFNSSKVRP